MSDLRAKVTVGFYGVPDGKVYPKHHIVGEIVEGDLAKVAIEEKWAVEHTGAETVTEGKTETAGDGAPVQTMTTASFAGADPSLEIPDDWRSMKWFALKALAEKIAGKTIADSDEAKAVVEAEIARRNPA